MVQVIRAPRATREETRGFLLVAAAAMAWGLWSLVLRPTGLPARVTAPVSMALTGILSLIAVPLEGAPARWDRISVALLLGNAVFDGLNMITFFGAIEHTTVAVAVLTHYLAPVLIALLAPTIERTRIPGGVVAAVGGLFGLALILEPWRPENYAGDLPLGALLGSLSAVAYAGNVFVVRRLGPRIGNARSLAYHSLLSAALLAPFAVGHLAAIELGDLALLTAGAAALGTLAGLAYIRGLTRIGSSRASILTFLEPIVAVLVGWLIWREPLGVGALIGGACVLGAGGWVIRG
jgi:drug/metabolite transporter (DMT)-like permease